MMQDLEKFDPKERFEFGTFWLPPITDPNDNLVCGDFRGVGGGGTIFSVFQKNDIEHEKNVIDFLMFLTTPESGRTIIEKTLENTE